MEIRIITSGIQNAEEKTVGKLMWFATYTKSGKPVIEVPYRNRQNLVWESSC